MWQIIKERTNKGTKKEAKQNISLNMNNLVTDDPFKITNLSTYFLSVEASTPHYGLAAGRPVDKCY